MNEAMCTAPCIVLDAKNESILMSFFGPHFLVSQKIYKLSKTKSFLREVFFFDM